ARAATRLRPALGAIGAFLGVTLLVGIVLGATGPGGDVRGAVTGCLVATLILTPVMACSVFAAFAIAWERTPGVREVLARVSERWPDATPRFFGGLLLGAIFAVTAYRSFQ